MSSSSSQPGNLKSSRSYRNDKTSRETRPYQDLTTPGYVSHFRSHTSIPCRCHYDGDCPTGSRTTSCDDLDGLHREDFVLFPSYYDPHPRQCDAPGSLYSMASPPLPSYGPVVLYGGDTPQSASSSTHISSYAENVLQGETATCCLQANSSRRRKHRGHINTSAETLPSPYIYPAGPISSLQKRYSQEAKVYYPPSPSSTPRVQRLSTPDFADSIDEDHDDYDYVIEPGCTASYGGDRRTTMDRNCQCCPFLSLISTSRLISLVQLYLIVSLTRRL